MERLRETWAEINLDALLHNYNEARKLLEKGTKLAAVLKADAYGHGAPEIAGVLAAEGADMFAVACLTEALEIRRKLPLPQILIMGYTFDHHLKAAVENDITLTVFSIEQAELVSQIAAGLGRTAKIHVKIDTGFNRLGMKPGKDTEAAVEKMAGLGNLEIEGIFSHLALTDRENDKKQFDLFMNLINNLKNKGIHIPVKHICDSIGMVRYPDYRLDMVRAGAFLYGAGPKDNANKSIKLEPALALKTRIALIKEIGPGEGISYDYTFKADRKCRVGTLPAGYADGYPRCLSNKGFAGVRGKRARVIGLICMDQCMIDLTDIPEAELGDEVVLIGGTGPDGIPLLETADLAGTNRNEILSGISRRVPRVYIKNNKVINIVDYLID